MLRTPIGEATKIYVTGHRGLLGSAIVRVLTKNGYSNIIVADREELDLRDQYRVALFLKEHRPEVVIHCGAKVGGIHTNLTYPADFIYDNLSMQMNVIHGSHLANIQTLVAFGSNCMYPKEASQPMGEELIFTGPVEKTNLAYGMAKLGGMVLTESYNRQFCRDYFYIIPATLYGPGDNFDPRNSHVTPALIVKTHQAKLEGKREITIWGSGDPRRELLFVDDAAEGVLSLLKSYDPHQGPINMGYGNDHSIKELAELIKGIVGYEGKLQFDTSKPDGMMRKLLSSNRMRTVGFEPRIGIVEGLKKTYDWFLQSKYMQESANVI